jgi:hypothetical protein
VFRRSPEGWLYVCELRRDRRQIEQVQRASRETDEYGFPTRPALFGSPEWWRLVENGQLPTHVLDGHIIDVYWGSMGDWPEFRLLGADGTEYSLTREGDPRRYVPGIRAQVRRVELERKPSAFKGLDKTTNVVLSVLLQDVGERSPGITPGPGGHGYLLAGGAGTRIHYFWLPTQPKAEDIAATRRVTNVRTRTWEDFMGGAWLAASVPSEVADDALVAVHEEVARRGGRYDGHDVVPAPGEDAAANGPSRI